MAKFAPRYCLFLFLLISFVTVSGQDASEDEDDGDDSNDTKEEGTCSWFDTIIGMCHKRAYNVKIKREHPDNLKHRKHHLHEHHHRHHHHTAGLPESEDLRYKMPPVYHQGNIGSCTANALIAALQYDHPDMMGSRLFVYYNERRLEGHIPDDVGATLADGVRALTTYGICPEHEWPYEENRYAQPPSQTCYEMGKSHHVVEAHNVHQNLDEMRTCLASGHPFVVGIMIYESFESAEVARTGMVPMPPASPTDKEIGGHAVLCVGYDDAKEKWIMRNSWGANWGDKGYFYLDYDYLLDPNLSTDLWTITKAT